MPLLISTPLRDPTHCLHLSSIGGRATAAATTGMGEAAEVGCTVLPVFKHLQDFPPLWHW
jgi:hypothetical protein